MVNTPTDKLEALEAEIRSAALRGKTFLAWADELAAIRAEMGEAVPVAWISTVKCVGPNYGKEYYGKLPIQSLQPGYYAHTPLYTTPPATVPVEALEGLVEKLLDDLTALIAAQEKP